MRTTRLGRRGPRVPPVGIGTWQLGGRLWGPASGEQALEIVEAAAEHGLLFFDTAELYGRGRSEQLLGEALRRHGLLDEAVIMTKVAGWRVTWHGVRKALEASKRRLGRAPDIVLYHWPPPIPYTPCHAAKLLEKAHEHGLAAWIGVSNFNAKELEEAIHCTKKTDLVTDQVHYNLAHRVPEARLKPTAEKHGATLTAWSPLAKGALAGKTRPDNPARLLDPVFARAARDEELQHLLEEEAKRHNTTKAAIALAWIITKAAIPIPGTRRRSHVEQAAAAARLAPLPQETMKNLDAATTRYTKGCYNELHWNKLIPPPLQAALYTLLGGV